MEDYIYFEGSGDTPLQNLIEVVRDAQNQRSKLIGRIFLENSTTFLSMRDGKVTVADQSANTALSYRFTQRRSDEVLHAFEQNPSDATILGGLFHAMSEHPQDTWQKKFGTIVDVAKFMGFPEHLWTKPKDRLNP